MANPFNTTRDDALGDFDTVGLIEALKNGSVSGAEVREAALARADSAKVPLNAVAAMIDNPQLSDGPFAGVPSFIKDNEDLAGLPTSHGSRATSRMPKSVSGPFVSQFEELGFTVLGKTTLPEFGLTANTESLAFGSTCNPRNPDYSAGGSSGGSAALVAAGVVPMAHANDGGGSIRIPAACCGLVGLKPSRGRLISKPELDQLPVAIAVQGVVTRSVRDTALFYSEIEKIHQVLPPMGHVTGPSDRRLRIALVDEGLPGLPVDHEVTTAVRDAAQLCESLGHDVELIPFPFDHQFGQDFLRYWAALAFAIKWSGKKAFDPEFDKGQLEPLANRLSRLFLDVAVRTPSTLRRLRRFEVDYATAFADYDVMLSPVTSTPAPVLGFLGPDIDPTTHLIRLLRYASFTAIQNVSGAPAISLPMAVSQAGLPIGVQVSAPFGKEATLLELAYEIEEAVGWC